MVEDVSVPDKCLGQMISCGDCNWPSAAEPRKTVRGGKRVGNRCRGTRVIVDTRKSHKGSSRLIGTKGVVAVQGHGV